MTKGGYRRQRGSRVPDSWLNFKWTLSNCRVRTSSWGMMAAELSLSKLSFRLLRTKEESVKKKKGRARRSNVIAAVCFHTSDKTIVKTARRSGFLHRRRHWRRRRAALELTEVSPESASGCWWGGALLWCWTPAPFSGSPGSALCLSTHTQTKPWNYTTVHDLQHDTRAAV